MQLIRDFVGKKVGLIGGEAGVGEMDCNLKIKTLCFFKFISKSIQNKHFF
jgi:hypothetical protein